MDLTIRSMVMAAALAAAIVTALVAGLIDSAQTGAKGERAGRSLPGTATAVRR